MMMIDADSTMDDVAARQVPQLLELHLIDLAGSEEAY